MDAPLDQDERLRWEKELLGVYLSEHPFRRAAQELAAHTTHQLADLSLELIGQAVTVAGMITQVTVRYTRDNRRFYLMGLEDLSGPGRAGRVERRAGALDGGDLGGGADRAGLA